MLGRLAFGKRSIASYLLDLICFRWVISEVPLRLEEIRVSALLIAIVHVESRDFRRDLSVSSLSLPTRS